MGHQIIKQPDGRYAVFSSFTDQWVMWDATAEDLERYYAEKASNEARERTRDLIGRIERNPRRAYYQFTMTFEQANRVSVENHGVDLSTWLAEQAEGYDEG